MKAIKFLAPVAMLIIASCCGDVEQKKGPNYQDGIYKEQLNRGVMAIHNGEGVVSVSWRYLESDPVDVAFDLYRQTADAAPVKLNSSPLTESTFYKDVDVVVAENQRYIVVTAGESPEKGESYLLTPEKAAKPYLEIPIKSVEGYEDGFYSPNDAIVGDLDGDGEYEIVVKMETRSYDNSRGGICEEGNLLDAYELDGTFMWRVDLGINIRQGAHYTQLMMHDFDGDDRSELAVKTAEGTKFGDGSVIPDTDGDGRTDYRNMNKDQRTYGMILEGPEFLSVIDGQTGAELARAPFISRGDTYDFGDAEGNRVDRFLGGVGYFDGKLPSIVTCRGYYSKTVVEVWDYRNGKLSKRWTFDTTADDDKYIQYEKQGNHNLRIGDIDGDGKDEIVYGACAIDHDGTGIYSTGYGHGDAMHMSDLLPWREGLEVWQCHETSPLGQGSEMRDAATGELIWCYPSISDVGRANSADIDPRFPGAEAWASNTPGTYTADGRMICGVSPSVNFSIWWDGDLSRELLDGYVDRPAMPQMQQRRPAPGQAPMPPVRSNRYMRISKWNGAGVDYFTLPGEAECSANNGTKSNPAISADLFGDWREELVVRTSDNKYLRVYMTDIPTEYRFHTLMSDIIYRNSVAAQNIAYNQPPEPGYYLGEDLGDFWMTRWVRNGQAVRNSKAANDLNNRLQNTTLVVLNDIVVNKNIATDYTLDARMDYDSYEWTINGKVAGNERTLTLSADKYGYDKPISIHIKTTYKGEVFESDGTLTFSSEDARKGYWSERDAQRTGKWEF